MKWNKTGALMSVLDIEHPSSEVFYKWFDILRMKEIHQTALQVSFECTDIFILPHNEFACSSYQYGSAIA